jgi:hypothetical protein
MVSSLCKKISSVCRDELRDLVVGGRTYPRTQPSNSQGDDKVQNRTPPPTAPFSLVRAQPIEYGIRNQKVILNCINITLIRRETRSLTACYNHHPLQHSVSTNANLRYNRSFQVIPRPSALGASYPSQGDLSSSSWEAYGNGHPPSRICQQRSCLGADCKTSTVGITPYCPIPD